MSELAESPWALTFVAAGHQGVLYCLYTSLPRRDASHARRGGRVAEGGCLENSRALSPGGSNPSLSATGAERGKVPERSNGVAC